MTALSLQTNWNPSIIPQALPETVVALPTKEGYELVKEESIVYCRAEGNYTKVFFLDGRTMLISRKLKETAASLDDGWFLRIHQSFLVNMRYARQYLRKTGGRLKMIDGESLPISKKYKLQVLNLFKIV